MPEHPATPANRTPRPEREQTERPAHWQPPSILPSPNPVPGWVFKWKRVAFYGETDTLGMSRRLREGWVPVRREEVPEIAGPIAAVEKLEHFPDAIIIGGLMLCKIPEEIYKQRQEYYDRLAAEQLASVNTKYMPEENPKMPLITQRISQTSVGSK